MGKLYLFFEELAKKHFSKDRIQKYGTWIENANKGRTKGLLDKKLLRARFLLYTGPH
jgi:hypothetical protein